MPQKQAHWIFWILFHFLILKMQSLAPPFQDLDCGKGPRWGPHDTIGEEHLELELVVAGQNE
jgi:hypothetical protein